jgi:2-(1,2-epoxy-1,2-dihydrophenyl)acetyl-CoA isomerase
MSDRILLSITDAVASVTLNRPSVYNAMDAEMIVRLKEVTEQLQDDRSVRVVVLRGAGPAFLAGGDVALFHKNLDQLPEMIVRLARELHYAVLAIRRMRKPVLASVHGAVAGAGLSLMAAADLAIAAADAKFTMAYSRIATSPDGGGTFFLARTLGLKKAMELALLSDTFDAASAQALGLVNWVVPASELAAQTEQIAQRLARGPTLAYGETKQLMDQAFGASLEQQLEAEAQAFARCARSHDLKEGVNAFVEKRKPQFKGE